MLAVVAAVALYGVGTADLALHDAARNRDIPLKVYYPIASGRFPLIVFSHGYGGSKDGYSYLGQGWAAAGYVVALPTHAGSDRAALLHDGPGLAGDPSQAFAQQLDRVADVDQVIASIDRIERALTGWHGSIDTRAIGVGGHSMGAGTAMLLGGAVAAPPGESAKPLRNALVQAIVAMSPQGPGEEGFGDASWGGMHLPVMTMSGTRDSGTGGQPPSWRLIPYARMPAGDKYQVVVQGAGHFAFALTDRYDACILDTSIAFWNRYLKGKNDSPITSDGDCAVASK